MNYCLLGATNKELGRMFGVDERTINRWLVTKPEFRQAVKAAARMPTRTLPARFIAKPPAPGHSPPSRSSRKSKSCRTAARSSPSTPFPPDTAAAFIWLKNRQPHRWRDKKEVHETGDHASQQPVVFELSPASQAHVDEVRCLLGLIPNSPRREPRGARPAVRPMARGRAMAPPRTDNGGGDLPRLSPVWRRLRTTWPDPARPATLTGLARRGRSVSEVVSQRAERSDSERGHGGTSGAGPGGLVTRLPSWQCCPRHIATGKQPYFAPASNGGL